MKDVWLNFIEATINPEILAGIQNNTSNKEAYIKILKKSFGESAKEISEIQVSVVFQLTN